MTLKSIAIVAIFGLICCNAFARATNTDIVDAIPDDSELVFDQDFTVLAYASPHWDKTPMGVLPGGGACHFYVSGDKVSKTDRLIKAGRKLKTVDAFEGASSGVYLYIAKGSYVAVFCDQTLLTIGDFKKALSQVHVRLELAAPSAPPVVEFEDLDRP
jgi:hypothetical protein